MKKQQAKQKQNDIIMLVVVFSVLILLNFVGSFLFKRFDLTAEKRYTLSESTKKLIKNLLVFRCFSRKYILPNKIINKRKL